MSTLYPAALFMGGRGVWQPPKFAKKWKIWEKKTVIRAKFGKVK